MAEEFKVIDTQEAFDAAIQARLDRQKKTVTAEVEQRFAGYMSPEDAKKLSDQLAAAQSDIQKLTGERDALKRDALKSKIANEAGLPQELAARLTGDTEEALRKDAQALAGFVQTPQKPAPSFRAELPPPENASDTALRGMLQTINGAV